jgi:hypothetical protein
MTDDKTPSPSGFLGISDPDAPLYRIFPLWFLEEALRLRQLLLFPPCRWEDPLEDLPSRIVMNDPRTNPWRQQPLQPFLRPAYAQCWSRTEESDTLLRAYSRLIKDPHSKRNTCPRDEGVQVRSSARKLLAAMQAWASAVQGISCFVGAVRYGPQQAIYQQLANLIRRHGPHALGRGQLRAQLLLVKRQAFAHEAEVRLICVDESDSPERNCLRIPIDPLVLFEEITFDPRLAPFERIERATAVRNLGYTGPLGQSELYQKILLKVMLPSGWEND